MSQGGEIVSEFVIETNELSKIYNGRLVVNNVNLHIEKGDIYGFVGENGAGKTTIMRMLCNLSVPDRGTYSIFGVDKDSKEISNARKKVSAIIETVALDLSKTALNNLKIQCGIADICKTDDELIRLIESVGLNYEEISNKPVKNFSLGMRQRIGLAMCMAYDPELILLDEPMNGLDPKGIIDMRNAILELNRRGVTFFISSHILDELDKVCNRIAFVSHGKLIKEITMDELHSNTGKYLVLSARDNDTLVEILKYNLGFKKIEVTKKEVIVRDEFDLDAVMSELVNNGVQIQSFSVKEENIEDFYMSIVGRRER